MGKLEVAHTIAKESESEQKWKQLADLALSSGKVSIYLFNISIFHLPSYADPSSASFFHSPQLDLAESCLHNAEDISGLLLLYTSTGNADGMEKLAKFTAERGRNNIAFICYFLLHRLEDCLNLLCDIGRIPEAAFLARTYMPR